MSTSEETSDFPTQAKKWYLALPQQAKVALIIGAAIVLILLIRSCFPGDARSIENVLELDHRNEVLLQQQIATGANKIQAITSTVEKMRAIDLSGCPSDFREAYVRNTAAWRDLALQLKQEPDGVMEELFVGFVNGLGGELDGGVKKQKNARDAKLNAISTTWTDVEASAVRHGAKLRP